MTHAFQQNEKSGLEIHEHSAEKKNIYIALQKSI
jgi:hypothetical protein